MPITDRVENPFKNEEFRSTTIGLSSMAERLAIERLINRLVIDWRNATTDLKTTGGGDFTGELTGVDSKFSGIVESKELVVSRLTGVEGGDFTTEFKVIDLWGAVHYEFGLDGGSFLVTPISYISGGDYKE